MIATGKFFLRRSETDALYIRIFHSALYQYLLNGPDLQVRYKDTSQSQWAEEITNDPHILAQLQVERYHTPAKYH